MAGPVISSGTHCEDDYPTVSISMALNGFHILALPEGRETVISRVPEWEVV
jgi:hypothetical protein